MASPGNCLFRLRACHFSRLPLKRSQQSMVGFKHQATTPPSLLDYQDDQQIIIAGGQSRFSFFGLSFVSFPLLSRFLQTAR